MKEKVERPIRRERRIKLIDESEDERGKRSEDDGRGQRDNLIAEN